MNFINSSIGDNRDDEPSSWVGSLIISLILVGACMAAGLYGASV